jgi:hypothetical protein
MVARLVCPLHEFGFIELAPRINDGGSVAFRRALEGFGCLLHGRKFGLFSVEVSSYQQYQWGTIEAPRATLIF